MQLQSTTLNAKFTGFFSKKSKNNSDTYNFYYLRQPKDEAKNTNRNRIICGVASLGIFALSVAYGIKKHQVKDIKNIQRTFKDVFMREDITIEETKNILHRYKEIEKIKDKKEYARALFDEAKKNYGLENTDITLEFTKKGELFGFCRRDNYSVSISPDRPRSGLFDTIHHELKHAKQHAIVYNEYPEIAKKNLINIKLRKVVDNLLNSLFNSSPKTGTSNLSEEDYMKHYFPDFTPKENIDIYKKYANALKEGMENYVQAEKDIIAYWNNYTEKDARKAGRLMSKYVKGKAFTPSDSIDDFICKHVLGTIKRIITPKNNCT